MKLNLSKIKEQNQISEDVQSMIEFMRARKSQ